MKIKIINKSKHKLAQILPGISLAIKKEVSVLNSPGTIDTGYRGEVCVTLINLSDEKFVIMDGERICPIVISKHERAERVTVDELVKTEGRTGSFIHT